MTELSLPALGERLAALGVSGVGPLSGGASSLTFAGVIGERPVVVKVAPPGVAATGHRDVLRQARVMRALHGTAVPVPEVLLDDDGDPPLFVMTRVAGTCMEPLFDATGDDPPDVVAQRFHSAAAALAGLHALDPDMLGLAGEPVVGPDAEVQRWCRTLDTVDPALVPDWHEVRDALVGSTPQAVPPAVVHGDFRLGNLMAVGGSITAVIDWEIWSLGDPRVDVGWFLINADPQTYSRSTPYVGRTPAVHELAATYGDVADLEWFCALACFKSAATWSLIVKHSRRRRAPDPELEAMASAPARLLARTRDWLR